MLGLSYCYLESLTAKPGTLIPVFDKEQLEYNLIINALDTKTELQISTEESSDKYKILIDNEEVKNIIELNEGITKQVQIVITSECMSNSRIYSIYITRISSKLAVLELITIHPGKLVPTFNSHIYHYTCHVAANISTIKLFFQVPDSKYSIEVNREEPLQSYELNLGCTSFIIKVQSTDESISKKYLIEVYRKEIPRFILISDPVKRLKYEDPISLSPLYCPVRINDYDIWNVMGSQFCTKLKLLNRLGHGKSIFEPRSFSIKFDKDIEKRLSDLIGEIPMTYGGFSHENRLCHLGNLLSKCREPSPFKPWRVNKKSSFPEKFKLNPKWQEEMSLYYYSNNDDKDFSEMYEETMIEYFFYLPNSPVTDSFAFSLETNPVVKLQVMIAMLIMELKTSPQRSDLHLSLAYLLEEKFMIQDTLNIKSGLFQNEGSQETKMFTARHQETIDSLCSQIGFLKPTNIGQQLRTLKDEHKRLLSHENYHEAERILNILEWKSKEVSEEGKLAMIISDTNNALGQAAYKYNTALSLDFNCCVKNYHVGRMLIFEGKYGEAIIRLEHALSIDRMHQPSRFLLGLAQANLKKLTETKYDKTVEMLLDGMEIALTQLSHNSTIGTESKKVTKRLYGNDENFFRLENPLICRGIFALAKLLMRRETHAFIKPVHVLHTALHLAAMGWVNTSLGYTMAQFEYIIIHCHDELLHKLNDEVIEFPIEYVIKRCEWLNAFISSTVFPFSERLLNIQEKVCQQLIFHEPCNEFYIMNLGIVLMKRADLYPPKTPIFIENICNAIRILRIAVDMNGRPLIGPPLPNLSELPWFKTIKIKFLTKKAPKVINETLNSVENDISIIIQEPTAKEIFEEIQRNRMRSTLRKSEYVNNDSERKRSRIKSVNAPRDSIQNPTSFATLESNKAKKNETAKDKHKNEQISRININVKNVLPKKVHIGDKTSLFRVCSVPKVKTSPKYLIRKHHSSFGVPLNPPTVYSRLFLARAYRLNKQYIDCNKCYNFIRKITHIATTKAIITQEMMEALLESGNYDQALDLMGKIVINEEKVTADEITMCKHMLEVLLKLGMFDDDRIMKYSLFISKYEGSELIKPLLTEYGLDSVLQNISISISNQLTDESSENIKDVSIKYIK